MNFLTNQSGALQCEEFCHSAFGEFEHFIHLLAVKWCAFRRALNFDKFSRARADDVHINFGVRIFFVTQIENRRIFDNPDADRRDFGNERDFSSIFPIAAFF